VRIRPGRARSESRGRDRRRGATDFIVLDTHACDACWRCVEACPNEVLGRLSILFHKHAKIVASEACTGCLKCERVCETGALERRQD
jgi:2-oxoglutarate ferredoxin oxidoreductase subunit delta